MKRYIIYMVCLLSAFTSCVKHEESDVRLALDTEAVEVGSGEGYTRIMVYGANDWNAVADDAEWVSLDEFQYGNARGSFRVNYAANENISRVARIVVSGNGRSLLLNVYQKSGANVPTLSVGESEIELPANRYEISVPVETSGLGDLLADVRYEVHPADDPEAECGWISDVGLNADMSALTMNVARNADGAARRATVNVSLAGADGVKVFSCDVDVRQSGEEAFVAADTEPVYKISPKSETVSVPVETNTGYMSRYMRTEIEYLSDSRDWIESVGLNDGELTCSVAGNSGDGIREAKITVRSFDADGNATAPLEILVRQGYYWSMSFENFRAVTEGRDYTFEDSFISYSLDGVVVSDCKSANMAYNPNTSYQTVDTSVSARTVYIQSEDARYGLRLLLDSADANVFSRGDRVTIGLNGVTVLVFDNPVAYSIENVGAGMFVAHTAGDASSLTPKRKTVAELTDDDIYTYTSLTDMEFVFKQGAYTNVNESYVQESELNKGNVNPVHIGDSSARLMQDRSGRAIYMQINSLCPWRRTLNPQSSGNHGVPQGVGTLSGIIVSEPNSRYGASDGSIGKYSIRPVDESDIAGADAIPWEASSARNTLAAWNFDHGVSNIQIRQADAEGKTPGEPYKWKGGYTGASEYLNYNGNATAMNRMFATDGDTSAMLYCDNLATVADKMYSEVANTGKDLYSTMTNWRPHFVDGYESVYIWDGTGENAKGYWKAPADEWSGRWNMNHFCGRNALGDYIWVTNVSGWYDFESGATKGFMMEFSSAAAATPMTVNFSMGAGGMRSTAWTNYLSQFLNRTEMYYAQNYPLYWKVQYSTDGGATWNDGATDAVTGASEFMLHQVPCWTGGVYNDPSSTASAGTGYPNAQMCLGLVEYGFVLPAAASGHDEVIVRITPSRRRIATVLSGADNYDSPLDQNVDATAASDYGNMIHFGGISIQY